MENTRSLLYRLCGGIEGLRGKLNHLFNPNATGMFLGDFLL